MSNLSLSPHIILEDIKAVWNYRALILNFAINDVKSRYRNTVLGYFWSLIEPLAWFGTLYFVLTIALAVKTENYAIYLFTGLILYHNFSKGTMHGMHSISSASGIAKRISLPLEITVVAATLSSSITMLLDFMVLLVMMVALQFLPISNMIFLPALLGLEMILVLAISLPLSVLSIFHRDLEHMWRIVTMLGFWVSPITFRYDSFPSELQTLILYNPMAGIIDLGHYLVLGSDLLPGYFLIYTLIMPFVILFFGYAIFKTYVSKVVEEI